MGRHDNLASQGLFNYAPETKENGALTAYREGTEITKVVRVLNEVYRNSETGFRVLQVEENDRIFTMKGVFPTEINLNGYYEVVGKVWSRDGEKQLDVSTYHSAVPTDRDGIVNVLKTLHGLDTRAEKLYSVCGNSVIEQIKTDPDGVAQKMKGLGIGKQSVLAWREQLLKSNNAEEALSVLLGYGIKPGKAKQLLDAHGTEIASQVKRNPYLLMKYLDGLSFIECDEIALKSGYAMDGIDRVQEAVRYGLKQVTLGFGHTCATKDQFVAASRHFAGHPIPIDTAKRILNDVGKNGEHKIVVYMLGKNRIEIDTEQLSSAVRAHARRRSTFAYPIYKCPNDVLSMAVNNLLTSGSIVREQVNGISYYRLSEYAIYETNIAESIIQILKTKTEVFEKQMVESMIDTVIHEMEEKEGRKIILEAKQQEAVKTICSRMGGIFLLTGPAGSGKTFVLRIIIDVLSRLYGCCNRKCNPQILAPTGKAAKVAEEVTKIPASTIHRFIGRATEGAVALKVADFFIIDEFSMVDEELFSHMIERVPPSSKVLILGDTEQLPSIGAGACLRDLMESGVIPCIQLDVVKRQSSLSGILVNANRVIHGETIQTERVNQDSDRDNAYFVPEENAVFARDKIVALVKKAGLSRLHAEQLQVLCPKRIGETGTNTLNYIIQQSLNPYRPGPDSLAGGADRVPTHIEIAYHDASGRQITDILCLHVRDRVIHIKNDYDMAWYRQNSVGELAMTGRLGVMNGETGVISRIYMAQVGTELVQRVVVKYGDEYVYYDGEKKSELMLAYAITIHKAQGSQWPIVLCPILKADNMMLNRQLIYTMLTRAQSTFFLVGSKQAVATGVEHVNAQNRRTMLKESIYAAMKKADRQI